MYPQMLGDDPYSCQYIVAKAVYHCKRCRPDAQSSGREEQSREKADGRALDYGEITGIFWIYAIFTKCFEKNPQNVPCVF
jgi:hypothetical protein